MPTVRWHTHEMNQNNERAVRRYIRVIMNEPFTRHNENERRWSTARTADSLVREGFLVTGGQADKAETIIHSVVRSCIPLR